MKLQHCMWACVAALLLASVALGEANAFGRRAYVAPGVTYYYSPGPIGGGMGLPSYVPGVTYGPYASPYPYYHNPYIAPYPAYGILPPPLATYPGYSYGYDPFASKRAAEYGYMSDQVDAARKRNALYPAVPFDKGPADKSLDTQRAQFVVVVPTADAVVIFDGEETKQKGLVRTFQTPPLAAGKVFVSTVEVGWLDEKGKRLWHKEQPKFKAGETITITAK